MIEDAYINETLKHSEKISHIISDKVGNYLSEQMQTKDGKVTFTAGNVNKLNKLSKTLQKDELIQKETRTVRSFILKTIMKLLRTVFKNQSKFDADAIKKSDKVGSIMETHAIRNIDELTDLSPIYEDIRLKSVSMMSSFNGISLEEMRHDLIEQIGKKNIVWKYWSRWTYDIYSQYQRAGANELRKELGLVFATFEGDLIDTSREWCEEQLNKVFHESEIEAWTLETWKGKNETNYNPFIDVGGYNCRHQLRWISKELAKRLRPDIVNKFPKEF